MPRPGRHRRRQRRALRVLPIGLIGAALVIAGLIFGSPDSAHSRVPDAVVPTPAVQMLRPKPPTAAAVAGHVSRDGVRRPLFPAGRPWPFPYPSPAAGS